MPENGDFWEQKEGLVRGFWASTALAQPAQAVVRCAHLAMAYVRGHGLC